MRYHDLQLVGVIVLALMIVSASCARQHHVDIMSLMACDSVPPARGTAAVPHVPTASPRSDRGAIVGTVSERKGGQPVPNGDATLIPMQAAAPVGARNQFRVSVDSLGGFALVDVTPGSYTLRVRAINHPLDERRVEVRAGRVDTVRVVMHYYACRGY
jgi:hypothetical protein